MRMNDKGTQDSERTGQGLPREMAWRLMPFEGWIGGG